MNKGMEEEYSPTKYRATVARGNCANVNGLVYLTDDLKRFFVGGAITVPVKLPKELDGDPVGSATLTLDEDGHVNAEIVLDPETELELLSSMKFTHSILPYAGLATMSEVSKPQIVLTIHQIHAVVIQCEPLDPKNALYGQLRPVRGNDDDWSL